MGLMGCAAGPSDGPGAGILRFNGVDSAITWCQEEDNGHARVIVATNARGQGVGIVIPHDGPTSVSLFQGDSVGGPCDAESQLTTVGDTWFVDASCFGADILAEIRSCELLDE